MKKREVRQGEIYFCDLDGIDSEQQGNRPCIIMSMKLKNITSPNVYVFPITHSKKKDQPTHYVLYKKDYHSLTYDENIILCEEGRSISKNRLGRFLFKVRNSDLEEIIKCKEYIFIEKK